MYFVRLAQLKKAVKQKAEETWEEFEVRRPARGKDAR
jgi:hypothetical protein